MVKYWIKTSPHNLTEMSYDKISMHSKITRDFAAESNYGIFGMINELWFGSLFLIISLNKNHEKHL